MLLGATAGIVDDGERAARRAADEALAADLERDGLEVFLERWLALPLFAGLSPDAAGVDDRRRNTAAGLAASLRLAGTGSQADLWGRLGRLDVPVLVLAGERDAKFAGIGRELAAAIGENARFEAVAGAGHAAHLEQPAGVPPGAPPLAHRTGLVRPLTRTRRRSRAAIGRAASGREPRAPCQHTEPGPDEGDRDGQGEHGDR